MYKEGDYIRIIEMKGEPQYAGRKGIIRYIDSIGQLHGTWGGCALVPGTDDFEIVKDEVPDYYHKTKANVCPHCGNISKHLRDSNYPKYDHTTDTFTKYFVCECCLTEWYETYQLDYDSCEVKEFVEDHYAFIKYDKTGNRKNK